MTSAPIMDMGVMATNAKTMVTPKGKDSLSGGFEQIIGKVTESNCSKPVENKENEVSSNVKAQDVKENTVKTEKDVQEVTTKSEQKTTSETSDSVTDVEDEQKDALEDGSNQILNEVAAILMMTPEELQNTLEQMGMKVSDLLQPENVNQLVTNVLGNGDPMSLITNEELSQAVFDINQCIEDIVTDLSEQLQVTTDELKETMQTLDVPEEIQEETTMDDIIVTDVVVNASDISDETTPVTNQQVDESQETQKPMDEVSVPQTNENQTAKEDAYKGDMQQNSHEEKKYEREDWREESFSNITSSESRPTLAQTPIQENQFLHNVDTQNVIDQINEYIKSEVKGTVNSIQLQLHPESLGNIGLTVAAKDGNVTAQFTTQNEAVKAALESQIVVLKENLEQQGVKVEAVEVTVSGHELEHNLEKDNQENMQQEEEQERLRKATRKLDLGQFADGGELEDLSEEDAVTVKMMQADGNSLDYKV